jgi:hypothetical protein
MINNHQKYVFPILFMIILFIIIISTFFSKDSSLYFQRGFLFNRFTFSKIKQSKPFVCPIQGDKWIVITSIFYPTAAVHKFLQLKSDWNLIVIADRKTPLDWLSKLRGDPPSGIRFFSKNWILRKTHILVALSVLFQNMYKLYLNETFLTQF